MSFTEQKRQEGMEASVSNPDKETGIGGYEGTVTGSKSAVTFRIFDPELWSPIRPWCRCSRLQDLQNHSKDMHPCMDTGKLRVDSDNVPLIPFDRLELKVENDAVREPEGSYEFTKEHFGQKIAYECAGNAKKQAEPERWPEWMDDQEDYGDFDWEKCVYASHRFRVALNVQIEQKLAEDRGLEEERKLEEDKKSKEDKETKRPAEPEDKPEERARARARARAQGARALPEWMDGEGDEGDFSLAHCAILSRVFRVVLEAEMMAEGWQDSSQQSRHLVGHC